MKYFMWNYHESKVFGDFEINKSKDVSVKLLKDH